MRVVADTNVLLSATFWAGDSNTIIQKVEMGDVGLILSKEIIGELSRVLAYKEIQDKIRNKSLEMKRTVERYVSLATVIEPSSEIAIIKDDPDDNKVLECAKDGKADFVISNDKHLLMVKEFEGIKIVTPKEFLGILRGPRNQDVSGEAALKGLPKENNWHIMK